MATVDRRDLDAALVRVCAAVSDPRAGIFGPGSTVWEISREAVVFLGGGRAALLQLAHPFVAQAVAEHSVTRTDVMGRFIRTFDHVFAMVYGDLDGALASARRVHAIHRRVTGEISEHVGGFAPGTAYAANTPEALLWVLATLWQTTIQVFELMVRPLAAAEKQAFYDESKRFAALFAVPEAVLPADWPAFERYWEDMLASPRITAGRVGAELGRLLLKPPGSMLGPMWDWYAAVTARLLPERLRAEFGLPYGRVEQALADGSLATIRALRWTLPDRLRYLPAYVDAQRRVAGQGPDALGRLVDRVWRAARGS